MSSFMIILKINTLTTDTDTDTDSLVFEIKNEDFYEYFSKHQEVFDFSISLLRQIILIIRTNQLFLK